MRRQVVAFFERSSRNTGNDYLIAFAFPAPLIKIADGKRINSVSKTAWIGDKEAYERKCWTASRMRRVPSWLIGPVHIFARR